MARNNPAPVVTRVSRGLARGFSKNLDEHVAMIERQVARGIRDGESRRLAVQIVSGSYDYIRDRRTNKEVPTVRAYGKTFMAPPTGDVCPPKNDQCEIERIWDFMVLNFRYTEDPVDVDTFQTLKESLSMGGGDCFPEGTLLLRNDGALVPVEQLQPGMKIWGRDRWSEVTNVWAKGELPVTAIHMNNGSWMHLTEGHKVFVEGGHRVPVSELAVGELLLQPDAIVPEGRCEDPKALALAELTGLFLADGWVDTKENGHVYRFAIAGKDGHPKEEQKRRVEALCALLGAETSWHERYIRVRSSALAQYMARFGGRAMDKHLLALPTSIEEARALVEGLKADAGANSSSAGYTFSSTSWLLAVQTRILHRMLGIGCGWAEISNHGGLGKNPIHRLYVRTTQSKRLEVKDIARNVETAPCWDITTDDHYVYLPEHDVTVSNCDDASIAFATLLRVIGYNVIARVVSTTAEPNRWAHIYPLVGVPKNNPTSWVALDTTVEGAVPGWEYGNIAKKKDYVL